MKKSVFVLVVLQAVFVGASGFSAWGAKELLQSTEAATGMLLSQKGKAAYDNCLSISAALNSQKIAARVEFVYEEAGQKLKASYFCHLHDTEIDCH